MFKTGDIIDIKISKLGYCGEGIYKDNGIIIFVPKTYPGDIVKVKINKIKKNYGCAELLNVINPSSLRINPECSAFNKGCGGCQWLNFNYDAQLYWKTQITEETLDHIGNIKLKINSIIPMNNPYYYRNKLSIHNKNGLIGLTKEKTNEIINICNCRQVLSKNSEIYNILNEIKIPENITHIHIRSNENEESTIQFFSNIKNPSMEKINKILLAKIKNISGIGISFFDKFTQISGLPFILQKTGLIVYKIPMIGFFQNNYIMAENLLNLVNEMIDPKKEDVILDLYCGVGFFSLNIARYSKKVYGIEYEKNAIKYAKENAVLNKINNTCFLAEDVKAALKDFKTGSISSIILDPPRIGCEKSVLNEIIRIKPKKIVYISCAPDTLSRDLKILLKNDYKIDMIKPLDMFPHTYHIENIVRLNL